MTTSPLTPPSPPPPARGGGGYALTTFVGGLVLFYATSCVWLRTQSGGEKSPAKTIAVGPIAVFPGTTAPTTTTAPATGPTDNWFAARTQRVVTAAGTDALEADVPLLPVPHLFTAPVVMHWDSLSRLTAPPPSQYWFDRVKAKADIAIGGEVRRRFDKSDEERCAVLSIADALGATAGTRTAIVPAGGADKWARVYQFDTQSTGGAKSRLEVQFFAEVDDAAVVDLDAQPTPTSGNVVVPTFLINFPPGDSATAKAVAPVYYRLYDFFAAAPAGPVSRVVRFKDADGRPHQWLVGADNQPGVATQRLTLINLGVDPVAAAPPAGYAARQWSDASLEAGKGGRPVVRHIGGLAGLPVLHRALVKEAIDQYLDQTPHAGTVRLAVLRSPTERLLMSFNLQPAASGTGLDAIVTGTSMDDWMLRRTADRSRLIAYYTQRLGDDAAAVRRRWDAVHPATPLPPGTDLAATRSQIAALLNGVDAVWLAKNYGVYVDDPEVLRARLAALPNGGEYVNSTKATTADEMLLLELVLQQSGAPARAALRGVHLGRCADLPGDAGGSKQAGLTLSYGVQGAMQYTVLIFDASYDNTDYTFTGDLRGTTWPITAHTLAHEMGHVIAGKLDVIDEFNRKFVDSSKAFTWYAESKPDSELFPEVFATFVLCPDWLRFNAPPLFDAMKPFSDGAGH